MKHKTLSTKSAKFIIELNAGNKSCFTSKYEYKPVQIQIKINGNPLNAITIPAGTFTSFVVERDEELTKVQFLDITVENLSATTATGANNVIVIVSKVE